MRVLGRAVAATGTHAIDGWIVQDLYSRFRLLESDPRAVLLAPRLRYEAARLRERLPVTKEEAICLTAEVPGRTFGTVYTPADLERILVAQRVPGAVTDCIDRAFSAMRLKGADTHDVRTVLLTGEGGALPAVQDAVRRHLPSCTLYAGHPADAVACGAALSPAPVKAKDRIARSYALRYWDGGQQEHHYRFLVHAGTRFPSAGQVARVVISAAYDGQTHLGIPLYEMGGGDGGEAPGIELVSEAGGGVRLAGPEQDAAGGQEAVHANERTPTLLPANPPARKGEPRFECTFTIDPDRNLRLSARDLVTGSIVKLDWPVHRLT
jgi:molecular chaperone DnaK (HSP70)